MKPNFESPAHTAKDLVERNITLYVSPMSAFWKQWLSQHDIPEYRKLAESMIIPESYEQAAEFTKNKLLGQGTHAGMGLPSPAQNEQAWAIEYDEDQGKY